MATIKSISGSPLIGNPITATITAASPTGTISFHRIKLQVIAALESVDTSYTTIEMSSPVTNGETVTIDISSALRAVADKYVYTPDAVTYPRIKFQLKAWDEYMSNGDVYTTGEMTFPSDTEYYYAVFGAYSDLERLKSGTSKSAQQMNRHPSTPQIIAVGETYAYTPALSSAYQMNDIPSGATSKVVNITKEGAQSVDGLSLYALPKDLSGDRYQFRFINGFGVLDSVSVKSLRQTEMNVTSTFHTIARKETFNSFSRGINRKSQDYETWKMSSGPLDKAWLSWFMHEFLMAEHVWILIDSTWVCCHIITDESVSGIDRTSDDMYEVTFSVRMDINGALS